MKHLLNDLSEEVKNSIREQHTGGMKVMTENFSKLTNTKSGDVKTLVEQQVTTQTTTVAPNSQTTKQTPGTWTVKDGNLQLMDTTGKLVSYRIMDGKVRVMDRTGKVVEGF